MPAVMHTQKTLTTSLSSSLRVAKGNRDGGILNPHPSSLFIIKHHQSSPAGGQGFVSSILVGPLQWWPTKVPIAVS